MDNDMKMYVTEGIRLLDSYSDSWRDSIDLDRLDVKDSDRCVLGQVFSDMAWQVYGGGIGGYTFGTFELAEHLDIDHSHFDPRDYGFDVDSIKHSVISDQDAAYIELTEEWKRAIAEGVQGADVPSVR